MYLKALEISGFKSFAKKDDLEFHAPITAIVGPNGSGKSNVAEAFRFVLGEQSIKSMRGKKGEDLIWGGSPSMARSNRAMVQIVLNNQKKIFPLDFDEITVERTVLRDGTNEYSINGSRTRLKDVQELLATANIGPTGHHIISQGEADRILSANPKERREMIEDALGLKIYQYKKAESERKLKKTEENVAHVESLRKEVQPHLKFLERQVKKIEKSLELRETLKSLYQEYLKREDLYITYHRKRLEDEKRGPESELTVLASELEKTKKVLQEAEKDEKRDALVELEKKLATLRTKRQDASKETGRLEGQITYLERALKERVERREKEAAFPVPFNDVKNIIDTVEKRAGSVKSEQDASLLQRTLDDIVRTLRSFLNDVARTEKETEEDTRDRDELITLKKEKETHDEVLRAVDEEERALRKEYEDLKTAIEAERTESREAEREAFRIMGRQRELEGTLAALSQELQMIDRDQIEFKREVQEAIALIGSPTSRYSSYQIVVGGKTLTEEELLDEARDGQRERRRELEKLKIRLEELGGGSADDILKEYKEVKERDEFLEHEIEDLRTSIASLEKLIAELTAQLDEQFIAGIEKIDTEFNRFFVLMFGGGSAKLERVKQKPKKKKEIDDDLEMLGMESSTLSGSLEPETEEGRELEASEGIEIDVKPPNKRVRGLDMLSGGERALTSIALIFAMSQVNPPLFLILDETDAALDEANSRRYGDMIESLAQKSQLILITHNRETMSRAGVLYGVTMGADGVSKLLSVKFDEAVAVAK